MFRTNHFTLESFLFAPSIDQNPPVTGDGQGDSTGDPHGPGSGTGSSGGN